MRLHLLGQHGQVEVAAGQTDILFELVGARPVPEKLGHLVDLVGVESSKLWQHRPNNLDNFVLVFADRHPGKKQLFYCLFVARLGLFKPIMTPSSTAKVPQC